MSQVTTATRKLMGLKKRIRAVAGGTSASKTYGIIQILIDKAQSTKRADGTPQPSRLISICSESMPHLKRGAIRDFQSIMESHGYWDDTRWNRTDSIYSFETGTKIEFFSVDDPARVRGPRRDILFINEVNNISYETFDQLEIRTNEEIWMDWNPTNEFWFYSLILGVREDVDFLTLTYKDNEALSQSIIDSIESHKDNKGWWQVYGLGQLGEVESKIYMGWEIIKEIPFSARLERRGLDFGYSRDPAALVDIYSYNGGYILEERLYSTGVSNKRIAELIKNLNGSQGVMTYADSAEPKSIDEIYSYGVAILPCTKGPGSVNTGIGYVKDQKISMTERSVNLIREYRNYLWKTDKNGKILTVPEDGQEDHLMDALRYGMESIRPPMKPYKQRNKQTGINLAVN